MKKEKKVCKKTKTLCGILAAVLITVLAFAVGIGAFALAGRHTDSKESASNTYFPLLSVSEESGIAAHADATEITLSGTLIVGDAPGPILTYVGTVTFTGTERVVTYPMGSSAYDWDMSCDVSEYVSQGYTNFRLHTEGLCFFEWKDNTLRIWSGNMNMKSFADFLREYPSIRINCDLPRVEAPLPDEPTKEGHHFVGWYYDAELTQPYDGTPVYEDTVLYAKFAINTYTVTYDTAGGKSMESVTVDWNTVAPIGAATRVGYDFIRWQLPDGTTYTDQPIREDTVLTAVWQIKTYTVTFYVGEEKYKEMTVEYGTVLADVMVSAHMEAYRAMRSDGVRVSKQSVITEDTQVLVTKLTGWEKYGDFVARHHWYTWVLLALGLAAAATAAICIAVLVKKR